MGNLKQKLLNKIQNKQIAVGVIGLGYVGLPLAVEKAKAGYKTVGFDIQPHKVEMVNAGRNYIGDVVDSDLSRLVQEGLLSATSDFGFVKGMDDSNTHKLHFFKNRNTIRSLQSKNTVQING